MGRTSIEWTDYSFNPWWGCTEVSEGCDHCYAKRIAGRQGVGWGPHAKRVVAREDVWRNPRQWARLARQRGIRPKVFCASMADVFDNQVPEEWRDRLWCLIEATPELDWLLLTKRPQNIERMLPYNWGMAGWDNVWLGFSAEHQDAWDQRWPILSRIPAAIRFCSYEPALGPLDILGEDRVDWMICGGESGPGYRPMDASWERSIRKQCQMLGISYFFKQLAGKKNIPSDFPVIRQFPQSPGEKAYGELALGNAQ